MVLVGLGCSPPWMKTLALRLLWVEFLPPLALVGPGWYAPHMHVTTPCRGVAAGSGAWLQPASHLRVQLDSRCYNWVDAHLMGSHVPLEREVGMCRWEGSTCICECVHELESWE